MELSMLKMDEYENDMVQRSSLMVDNDSLFRLEKE